MIDHDQVTQKTIDILTNQYGFNFDSMPAHRVFALSALEVSAISPDINTSAAPYKKIFVVDTQQGTNGDITVTGGYVENIDDRPTLELIIDGITSAVEQMIYSATLNDLADVVITNPEDGDFLWYDASSGMWINRPSSAFSASNNGSISVEDPLTYNGGVIGIDINLIDHSALAKLNGDDHTQYYNQSRGDARYSQLSHNHDLSYADRDIQIKAISPLVGTNRLSGDISLSISGLNSMGSSNQLVSMNQNGNEFEYRTVVAGNNINIEFNDNQITINADVSGTIPVSAHHLLDSTVHSDTITSTVQRGDLITGQEATPKWKRLGVGTIGQFVKSNGVDVIWANHGLKTSAIPESTNLYFTQTRARNSISASSPLVYTSATGNMILNYDSNTLGVNSNQLYVKNSGHNHGTGTKNFIPRFASTSAFENSIIQTNAANDSIGLGISPVHGLQLHDKTLGLSNPNVSHGMTSITTNNIYGLFSIINSNNGGLNVFGLSDADSTAINIYGILGLETTNTNPAIQLLAGKKNSTGWQPLGSTEYAFRVANYSTQLLSLLGDGRLEVLSTVQATRLISTIATGTAPLSVTSTTVVSNLNADLLDGQHGSYYTPIGSMTGTQYRIPYWNTTTTLAASPLRVDTGNNYIGIGVTPITTLDVYGSKAIFRENNSSINYAASIDHTTLQLGNNGVNYIVAGRTATGGSLRFYTNNTSNVSYIDGAPDGTLNLSLLSTGDSVFAGTTSYAKVSILGSRSVWTTHNWGKSLYLGSNSDTIIWNASGDGYYSGIGHTSNAWYWICSTAIDGSAVASYPMILTNSGALITLNNIQGTQFISTISTGTAPLSVNSTTVVSNLNADLLDGQHGSYYLNASSVSGTQYRLARFATTTSLGDSPVYTNIANTMVGIGMTPTTTLHIRRDDSNSMVKFNYNGTDYGEIGVNSTNVILYAANGAYSSFYVGGGEKVRIDTNGNLNIGTFGGRGLLDVGGRNSYIGTIPIALGYSGTIYPSVGFNFVGTSTANVWSYQSTDKAYMINFGNIGMSFNYAALGNGGNTITWSTAIRINDSGNFGFNTTDIEAWGSGYKAIEFNRSAIMYGTSSSVLTLMAGSYWDGAWKHKGTGYPVILQMTSSGDFHVYNVPVEGVDDATATTQSRFLIQKNGFIGIGDDSPSYKIDINYTSLLDNVTDVAIRHQGNSYQFMLGSYIKNAVGGGFAQFSNYNNYYITDSAKQGTGRSFKWLTNLNENDDLEAASFLMRLDDDANLVVNGTIYAASPQGDTDAPIVIGTTSLLNNAGINFQQVIIPNNGYGLNTRNNIDWNSLTTYVLIGHSSPYESQGNFYRSYSGNSNIHCVSISDSGTTNTTDWAALFVNQYSSNSNTPIIKLYNNAVERFRVNVNGYVGIGKSIPIANVHVKAITSNNAQFILEGGSNTYYWNLYSYDDNSSFNIAYNGTTSIMRLNSSGNFGFNTTDIESWFSAVGAIEFPYNSIIYNKGNPAMHINNNLYYDGDWKYKSSGYGSQILLNIDGSFAFHTVGSGTIDNIVIPTVRVKIDNDGYLYPYSVPHATTDTDFFLVRENNILKYRTGSEILSDIGGALASSITGTQFYIPYWNTTTTLIASPLSVHSGKIGVNTTSPYTSFHIFSNRDSTTEGDADFFFGRGNSVGYINLFMGVNQTSRYAYIGVVDFNTTYRPLILNPLYGNVGIHTINPEATLECHGPAWFGIDNYDTEVTTPVTVIRLFANGKSETYPISSFDFLTKAGYRDGDASNSLQIHSWDSISGQTSSLLTLKGNGNIGIGITDIELWNSSYGVIEFPYCSIMCNKTVPVIYLNNNLYYDGNWKYKSNGYGSYIFMSNNGSLYISTAPSGTIDNLATLSVKIQIDNDGSFYPHYVPHATTDTDFFLVRENNILKYRTGAEILSDIGGVLVSSITGTQYRIPYWNTTTTLASSQLYVDTSNSYIGIGVSPVEKFHIYESVSTGITLFIQNIVANSNPRITLQNDAVRWDIFNYGTDNDAFLLFDSTNNIWKMYAYPGWGSWNFSANNFYFNSQAATDLTFYLNPGASTAYIGLNTSDGSDSKVLYLCGGGGSAEGRGGIIAIFGNDNISHSGRLFLSPGSNGDAVYIGIGGTGRDYKLGFWGESAQGYITWMEDEDYFQFEDGIFIPSSEQIYFGNTSNHITYNTNYILATATTGFQISARECYINGSSGDSYFIANRSNNTTYNASLMLYTSGNPKWIMGMNVASMGGIDSYDHYSIASYNSSSLTWIQKFRIDFNTTNFGDSNFYFSADSSLNQTLKLKLNSYQFASISMNTTDGSDNKHLVMCGGGQEGYTRGAHIWLYGNEVTTYGGDLWLIPGSSSNKVYIGGGEQNINYQLIFKGNTYNGVLSWLDVSDTFKFDDDVMISGGEKLMFGSASCYATVASTDILDFYSNNVLRFKIDNSGSNFGDSNFYFNANSSLNQTLKLKLNSYQLASISMDTNDGSDNKHLALCGGGSDGSSRGAYIRLYGNEVATYGGDLWLIPGSSSNKVYIGNGEQNINYQLIFDGYTTNGIISWIDGSDYFQFEDHIFMNSNKRTYFGSTSTSIHQENGVDFKFTNSLGNIKLSSSSTVVIDSPKFRYPVAESTPSNPSEGDMYVQRTGSDYFVYIYLNGSWRQHGSTIWT